MTQPMTSMVATQKQRQVGRAKASSDLGRMTSVVVTTQDVQHHDLTDENAVAVSGIPGKIIQAEAAF